MDESPEYVSILEARDAVTAELAKGVLESEGIPVLVQSFQVPWYDGVMTAAVGAWGRILVPANLAPRAQQILDAYFHPPEETGAETEEKTEEK